MEDLSGLDWNNSPPKHDNARATASHVPLQPAPSSASSRQSTPFFSQQTGLSARSINSKTNPARSSPNDSFANLLAPQPSKPTKSLTLQERQKQLQEQQRRQGNHAYQADDASVWEGLGSRKGTPSAVIHPRLPICLRFPKE